MRGPNVKKLIVCKMSLLAIPPGAGPGDMLTFLLDPGTVSAAAREATRWVAAAIFAVRQAPGPNPWRTAPDEDIAAEILRRIEERK